MLLAARSKLEDINRYQAVRTFIFLLATALWVGVLSTQFVSALTAAAATLGLGAVLAISTLSSLASAYKWIEQRFLSSFNDKSHEQEDELETENAMRELAPWDIHLVRMVVHPNAPLAGLTLSSSGLKSQYGLTVVSIRRGRRMIGAPHATELLLPEDELLVLGSDDQIESARSLVEVADQQIVGGKRFEDYGMRSVRLKDSSGMIGQTVQSCALRENFDALIVGIERDSKRILNPPPATQLFTDDILWVVGPREQLSRIPQ